MTDTQNSSTTSTQTSSDNNTKATTAQAAGKRSYPIVLSVTDQNAQTSFIRGYKQFWPFLKPYWPLAVLGILLTIPVGALDAVVAYFLKPFMDLVMIEQQTEFASYVPYIIVGFTVIQGIFIYLSSYVNSYVGGKINLLIRSRLYKKLLDCDSNFYDVNNSGSVIFRFFQDAELASAGLIANIKLFLTKFFSSMSLVGVMIYNSWELTLFSIGILVFLVIPLRIVRRRIKKIVGKTVSGSTQIITLYNETTQGNRVIKSFGLKDKMFRIFKERADFLFDMGLKMVRDTNWLSPVMHFVASIGVAGVLFLGTHLILSGTITSGSFVSFLAALMMLYTPIKSIGNNYIQVQQSLLAIDRIYQLLDTVSVEELSEHSENTELTDIKESISFKDVHFSYNEEREILKGISFDIKVGSKVALVGNSGGGKTTVCSLIPRLYEIDSGLITIDGRDIKEYSLSSLRENIAMVFQDSFLFQGSIRDNIVCAKENVSEEDLENAIKGAYLDDFISSLPEGLDTQIGERGVSLSGGQKQRLSIARAILKNAPLVILDEATSALDNKSEKVVQKALDSLMKGRTTIVIAHRLSTIRDADTIMVINDGYVVERGSHDDLMQIKNGAYASLYNSQFKKLEEQQTAADDKGDTLNTDTENTQSL